MQQAASQGQVQGQRGRSPVVAGVGAALVASAVTLFLTGGPASGQAASSTQQCQMAPRKLLVSTETGSGTVRLRAGSYLSPPIAVSTRPQAVVFPLPRPETTPVQEVISIEGTASNVVITSDLTGLRHVFDVAGASAFNVTWKPLKTC